MDPNQFRHIQEIGKGSYGKVNYCTNSIDSGEYAVKTVSFPAQCLADVLREVEVMKSLDHPNIVRYYQSWIKEGKGPLEEPKLYIAMERYPRTLRSRLEGGGLGAADKLTLFKQLIQGLEHIHNNHVIHCDLKVENLFLDKLENLRIGDFGLALTENTDLDTYNRGFGEKGLNPFAQAPEMRESPTKWTSKLDIFAAGLVLADMFDIPNDMARAGKYPRRNRVDQKIRNLLESCLDIKPEERPTASELVARL